MKIYINGRFLTQEITGVQRYAIELLRALDSLIEQQKLNRSLSFILITPPNVKQNIDLKNIGIQSRGFCTGHLWEQMELPFYSSGNLLINLCNAAPLLKWKQIVTIHDAAVFKSPQAYSQLYGYWYRFLSVYLGKIAQKIITNSHFSKKELSESAQIKKHKLFPIYLGKEQIERIIADEKVLCKYRLAKRKYLFAVSSMNPNKNFIGIVKAIKLLGNFDYEVVIAGGFNESVFKLVALDLTKNIKHLGYVSDGELKALYQNALCFIFPSFYEGFGLPPLEAMACGCPVIVSRAASLPEIFQENALYCDPHNPADIAAQIKILVENPQLQNILRQKGLAHAKSFSWENCATETVKVIEEVLDR